MHNEAFYITEQPVTAMTSLNIFNLILNECKLLLFPECNYTDLQPLKKMETKNFLNTRYGGSATI